MKAMTPITTDPTSLITVQMTVEEYLSHFSPAPAPKKVAKGLAGIMAIAGCSRSHAFKIAHSEWFKPAIIYKQGKFISFDEDRARQLLAENTEM